MGDDTLYKSNDGDIIDSNKKVREYIEQNGDLTEEEAIIAEGALDEKTIAAFEAALEKVAQEHDREKSSAEIVANHIVDTNREERLVKLSEMCENPPEGMSAEELGEVLDNFSNLEELEHFVRIDRDSDSYFYSSIIFTEQFAMTMVLIEEKNILEIIANRTRVDCKIYPRPVQISALKNAPYFFSEEEIFGALDKMKTDARYDDMGTVEASNGGVCIYSSLHMSEKYAKSLCEYVEVEWKKNQ